MKRFKRGGAMLVLLVRADVEVKDFAILSIGQVVGNPKWFRAWEKKADVQRVLARR